MGDIRLCFRVIIRPKNVAKIPHDIFWQYIFDPYFVSVFVKVSDFVCRKLEDFYWILRYSLENLTFFKCIYFDEITF